jgi:hypothetical protein
LTAIEARKDLPWLYRITLVDQQLLHTAHQVERQADLVAALQRASSKHFFNQITSIDPTRDDGYRTGNNLRNHRSAALPLGRACGVVLPCSAAGAAAMFMLAPSTARVRSQSGLHS